MTGATGNVGAAVVQQLRDRQIPCRQGSHRATSVTGASEAQVVPFNFLDATTFEPAVQGCTAVFLLRPPAISNTRQTLIPFVEVARRAGVQQVVFISVAGAADNPVVPHHAVEKHLRQGASGWTILRPGFFAQNLGDAYRQDIVEDDRIFVPAGSGRVAFIDVRDVAEVAVKALIEPATHQGQTYTLTGPEAVTFEHVAAILSAELGRAIAYHPATIPGYLIHLRRRGMAWPQAIVQTVLHVGLRFGQAEAVDDGTLSELLGRSPRHLQDYVRDHQERWLTSP